MKIYIENHSAAVPLMEIAHAIIGEPAQITDDKAEADVISRFIGKNGVYEAETTIITGGEPHTEIYRHTPGKNRSLAQSVSDCAKLGYYRLACKLQDRVMPWGCCTGIRPAKIAARYLDDDREAGFMRDFDVSPKKAHLAMTVAENQRKLALDADAAGIYIGVPFCPSRCLYCSFVSLPMDKQKKVIQPYIDMLCRQIKEVSEILSALSKKIGTIYIGGGTPTSIDAPQLSQLLQCIEKYLYSPSVAEFTVEAGRPDTITEEKLRIMKSLNVSRISINPQTLNDSVLESIGRRHTAAQFLSAFELARKIGFNNINSDVIAGLMGESYEMFTASLQRLINMEPEGITVHTLCVKRAAELKNRLDSIALSPVSGMVDAAGSMLFENGYLPYYMYRQKDTLDNLENTGFAKVGRECLYNVFMMEDLGSVIGIGGGSVSKIIDKKANRIERVFNLKHPHEYVKNPEATAKRNAKLKSLLETM